MWQREKTVVLHECVICGKQFKYDSFLKKHVGVHERESFACEKCHTIIKRHDHFEIHVSKCQAVGPSMTMVSDPYNHDKNPSLSEVNVSPVDSIPDDQPSSILDCSADNDIVHNDDDDAYDFQRLSPICFEQTHTATIGTQTPEKSLRKAITQLQRVKVMKRLRKQDRIVLHKISGGSHLRLTIYLIL